MTLGIVHASQKNKSYNHGRYKIKKIIIIIINKLIIHGKGEI